MNRLEMIKTMQRLMPGTDASSSSVGQSECVVFKEGVAYSFNDQIAVRMETEFPFDGAIIAAKFLQALQTMDRDEVKIDHKDPAFVVSAGRRRVTLPIDKNIELPISIIEQPKRWRPCPENFVEALGVVARTAGKQENQYTLTCVHIAPDKLESTDNIQLIQWPMRTGLRQSALISGRAAIILQKYNIVETGLTDGWIHFKDDEDLVVSVRTHEAEYPDMTEFLAVEGEPVLFPPDIGEVAGRAAGFLDTKKTDKIKIQLEDGRMFVEGTGSSVEYEERGKVDYDGPPIAFFIHPAVCQKLAKEAKETFITDERIKVITDHYQYVAVLQKVKE
jgi:hypothetical protein